MEVLVLSSENKQADLSSGDLALLLISEEFLSDDIQNHQVLDTILSRATDESFLLLPIISRECEWEDSPYAGLSIVPTSRVSISRTPFWGTETAALEAVREQVKEQSLDLIRRRSDPAAYAQAKAAELTSGPSASRLAMRLAWQVMPRRWRKAVFVFFLALVLLLVYLAISSLQI